MNLNQKSKLILGMVALNLLRKSNNEETYFSETVVIISPPPKPKRSKKLSETVSDLNFCIPSTEATTDNEDEDDHFGKFVISQMKKIPKTKVKAKRHLRAKIMEEIENLLDDDL